MSHPSIISSEDFKGLLDLIALMADPTATQERLNILKAASDEARALIEQATIAQSELASARREHSRTLAAERQDHDKNLAALKKSADEAIAQGKRDLEERKRQVALLERDWKADLSRRLKEVAA